MTTLLSKRFAIHRLSSKVQKFLQECLLCKHIKGGHLVQRPWGPTFKVERHNEGVHWDYLTLGASFGQSAYVLVIKDALTHYYELFPSASPSAWNAADGMVSWYMRSGKPEVLVSDQGPHFQNEMVKMLCSELKVEHAFTPVYSPWVNGTIERGNKDILQVLRALLIEYKLDAREWPYLLPIVQANIKHTLVESLGNLSPIELFLDYQLHRRWTQWRARLTIRPAILSGKVGDDAAMYLDNLRAALRGMHKDVIDRKERKRLQAVARLKGSPCNCGLGDYVLWSRVDKRISPNKLIARWAGPFKLVELRLNSFLIKNLLTGMEYKVHGSRLKLYSDSSFNVTEEIAELISNQGMLLGVEKFKSHRYNAALRRWELLVSWVGLTDSEDPWEPVIEMLKDVQAKVSSYVNDVQEKDLREAIQEATGTS
ncbi:unnamed protein product [Phytophthora fragariaefolia]|uniref:Unnamed protein product n=1 Tax=Phytophthora fragariaefolia TaxID=1490495 RepID=A0A9W6U0P2_9STRA|nr:unnamed protein product [Phytophthora fragariaefolia]